MAIEKWGRMRETTNKHFKFTPRTTAYVLVWAVLVPFGVWRFIRWDVRRRDRAEGREPRDLF